MISCEVRSKLSRDVQVKSGLSTRAISTKASKVLLSSVPAFTHCELKPAGERSGARRS